MCRDILVNFTSYYRCSYRMRLARKVLLESKFVRYSRFESPVYVLWLKTFNWGHFRTLYGLCRRFEHPTRI